MAIVFAGVDLAKDVFALHGANEHGKPELVRPSVPRAKLLEQLAKLPPCTIGTEAWSRPTTTNSASAKRPELGAAL